MVNMTVTTKNGKQGTVVIDSRNATASVEVEGRTYLVAFVRDAKKVVIKNDFVLNDSDLATVRQELQKFVKKQDDGKKGKRK
jgi:hypothetical protein